MFEKWKIIVISKHPKYEKSLFNSLKNKGSRIPESISQESELVLNHWMHILFPEIESVRFDEYDELIWVKEFYPSVQKSIEYSIGKRNSGCGISRCINLLIKLLANSSSGSNEIVLFPDDFYLHALLISPVLQCLNKISVNRDLSLTIVTHDPYLIDAVFDDGHKDNLYIFEDKLMSIGEKFPAYLEYYNEFNKISSLLLTY